jgi:hypothetical protein
MEIEFVPFIVPDVVYQKRPPVNRGLGHIPLSGYRIEDIPDEDLERLCEDFRKSIFEKKHSTRM